MLQEAVNNDDELFMALGAFALAYSLLLGGEGAAISTADLRALVRMASAAMSTLDRYNMKTVALQIVVRVSCTLLTCTIA